MNTTNETTTNELELIPPRIRDLLVGAAVVSDYCTPEAVVALPDLDQIETAPRIITAGSEATTARPSGAVVLAAAVDAHFLVEGVRLSGDRPVATFVASVTTDAGGNAQRYVEYACNGARRPLRDATDSPGDAALATVVDRYFHALDDGDFDAAADCFAADVLYSHPPYRHTGIDGGDRVEFNGRAELRAAFERRGPTSFDHVVDVVAQRGAHGLIEGRVLGLPDGRFGSFISSCSLDLDGRIERYVSFYCEPGVPR